MRDVATLLEALPYIRDFHGETEVFFSDLSPEYVNYNADYTS